MFVGVSLNEARIDGEAFTADEAGRHAGSNDTLKHFPEDVAVAEALVTGARESRVIRDLVFDAQAAEPAIGEVKLDLAAQRTFRADGEHVTDDEYPDHQHRINRRSSSMRIVRGQL